MIDAAGSTPTWLECTGGGSGFSRSTPQKPCERPYELTPPPPGYTFAAIGTKHKKHRITAFYGVRLDFIPPAPPSGERVPAGNEEAEVGLPGKQRVSMLL